jgi:hypothetical protein
LEKYKRENPGATDTNIDINSILPDPSNNASNSSGARVPFPRAPELPMLARQVPRPAPAARPVQAILHAQEIQPQMQQFAAVADRQARIGAVQAEVMARHAAQLARVRPPFLNPANYAVAFEGLLLLLAIYLGGISMGKLITSRA